LPAQSPAQSPAPAINMTTDLDSLARQLHTADPLAAEFLITHMQGRKVLCRQTKPRTVRDKLAARGKNLAPGRILEILDCFEHHGLGVVTNRSSAMYLSIHWANPEILPGLADALAAIKAAERPGNSRGATQPGPNAGGAGAKLPHSPATPPPVKPAHADPGPLVLCAVTRATFDQLRGQGLVVHLSFIAQPPETTDPPA